MGESFSVTPVVLPVRGYLDEIKRMMLGDFYIGRGCRQRGLGRSEFCKDFKVAVHGRDAAISKFAEKLASDHGLAQSPLEVVWAPTRLSLPTVSGAPR